ncbi:MAG: RNA 2',3'-cyclic phosphodiesterase [Casimicrobiaceae bacterium]
MSVLPDLATPEAAPPVSVRLFFALVPEPSVRLAFGELARAVARRSRGRSISADYLHLTLAFLGDVPGTAVPLLRAVGDAMPQVGATLVFDTLGAWRASGVAWVAPAIVPQPITDLHAALAAGLARAGFALEERAFRPHITLARRCVQPQPRTRCEPLRWRADRLCLVGSELQPAGPVYRELATWPLTISD